MNEHPRDSGLVRLAIAMTTVGVLISLGLLVRETPYTLAFFMFAGQPLLAIGFSLFAWRVVRDLRRTGLL